MEGGKGGKYDTTQPQTMSRASMGIQGGRDGCLQRLPGGGGADTALNTSAARLACMPLHSCPRPHRVHTGCTLTTITPAPLTPAPQGHGHTKKEEALPEPYVAWRRASKSKAHPSVLQTLRSWKNRGEALGRGPGQSHTAPTPQTVPPRCVLVTKEGQTGGLSL